MKHATLTTFSLIPIFIGALWLWEYFTSSQPDPAVNAYKYEIKLSWAVLITLTSGFMIPGKTLKLFMVCVLTAAVVTGTVLLGFFAFGSSIL